MQPRDMSRGTGRDLPRSFERRLLVLISAVFVHHDPTEDEPPPEITLRGKRRKEGRDRTEEGRVIKHSSVHLVATIPHDAPPGLYRCRTIEALTTGGQTIPFEDPNNEVDFDLWVLDARIEDEDLDGRAEAQELREALERVLAISLEVSEELDAYQDRHARE